MCVSATASGVLLRVRAQPRSSRAGVVGLLSDTLKVCIRSAPVEGKANAEIIEVLADFFHLPKCAFSFVRGETAKTKFISISQASLEEIRTRIKARVSKEASHV